VRFSISFSPASTVSRRSSDIQVEGGVDLRPFLSKASFPYFSSIYFRTCCTNKAPFLHRKRFIDKPNRNLVGFCQFLRGMKPSSAIRFRTYSCLLWPIGDVGREKPCWAPGKAGQEGTFRQIQILHALVKVVIRRHRDPIGTVTQINLVEIEEENLLLERYFSILYARIASRTFVHNFLGRQEEGLHHLLGDRASP